ncbi:MAG: hypothetical protein JWM12_2233 [Ilumatobacteraceae bacterium]|nr:hypothetical protein [Ilumatobacteraceae bacterium]
MGAPTWTIDAPGQWALDMSHSPGGTTPLMQAIMTASMPAGMRRMFRDLGAPIDTLDVRFVHGHFYTRLRPLFGADKPPRKLPPAFVLKAVARLHPTMRARTKTAASTLTDEPWTKVIADWRNGGRARVESQNLALQDVDLTALDDVDVAVHAVTCFDHCITNFELHFWLHGYDLGPLGQYLYEGRQWGLGPADLLPLLEGASPSTSEPGRQLRRIRELVERHGATPASLDDVRALSPEGSAAVDAYLRYRSAQLFSRYDLDGVTLGERPDLVLAGILNAEPRDTSAAISAQTGAVRDRVPPQHRDRFDEVLRQAREAMDLRDDNGPNTAEWPLGLLRLALLELGRRMVAAGRAHAAEHALELTPDELRAARRSVDGPGADALATRGAARVESAGFTAPKTIGDPEPAPPLDTLPAPLAHLVGMVQTVRSQMAMGPDALAAASNLHGTGVGTQSARGTARVARSPEEALDKLEPGDILVVTSTTPAYNLVLSLAGGVVTTEGGPLSHAAVLARELGIPAVVGAAGALAEIPDGTEVEIDPVAGEVRIVRPA